HIIYTSGSTGQPKGVVIEHRNAVILLNWAIECFGAEALTGTLASTSICFDLSVFELFAPLSCGGKIVLVDNILELTAMAGAGGVTLINTVPSAMTGLLAVSAIPASVETINLAGEPLHNRLAQQIYQEVRIERLYNLYGPSEDTTYSTFSLVERGSPEQPTIG